MFFGHTVSDYLFVRFSVCLSVSVCLFLHYFAAMASLFLLYRKEQARWSTKYFYGVIVVYPRMLVHLYIVTKNSWAYSLLKPKRTL